MYAVIKTGGKQYRVAIGEKLKIEQILSDVGSELVLNEVLAISHQDNLIIGTPTVANASVKVAVLEQGRHDKVRIFKMRRRKHYQKRQGHRQNYTLIEIKAIEQNGVALAV
jgi:large subunit ribosomal protein L21